MMVVLHLCLENFIGKVLLQGTIVRNKQAVFFLNEILCNSFETLK